MILNPTVFVLGAGASCHLGFPTAQQLRRLILREVRPGNRKVWEDYGFDAATIDGFRRSFESSVPSIDAFLELHPEFDSLGKSAIAHTLIPLEDDATLWRHLQIDAHTRNWSNWYEYLFTLLRAGVAKADDFWDNRFSVITFNYDRSLEHYLARCLESSYGLKYEDSLPFLRQMVVHVHGNLSPLGSEDGQRAYRLDLTPEIVAKASRSIRVVHEGRDLYTAPPLWWKNLSSASRIIFLGFGYDRENLAKLNWRKSQNGQAFGTSVGLETGEEEAISLAYGIQFKTSSSQGIEYFLRNLMPAFVNH